MRKSYKFKNTDGQTFKLNKTHFVFLDSVRKKPPGMDAMIRRFFDLIISLVLVIPAIIIIVLLFIILKILNKHRSFLYTGKRIGKNQKIFHIYKIRTLESHSENLISSNILNPGSNYEIRLGRLLRNARLDELPQIFNVICGDLSIIGPRPVRPEIFEKYKDIFPNYHLRFTIKPGLIWHSQLLTPHNSPKRVRALVNFYHLNKRRSFIGDIKLVGFAAVHLLKNLFYELFVFLKEKSLIYRYRNTFGDRRFLRRIKPNDIKLIPAGQPVGHDFKVNDINNEAIKVSTNFDFGGCDQFNFILVSKSSRNGKIKQAKCSAIRIIKNNNERSENYKWQFILFYKPNSELNRYLIDKYVLKQSICP